MNFGLKDFLTAASLFDRDLISKEVLYEMIFRTDLFNKDYKYAI